MDLPELQYRNNDPSENVQVEFTDLGGIQRVLSFVATRPHWCEQPDIYGDLFDVPLAQVFEGEIDPVPPGSAKEEELIRSFREFVNSAIQDPEFFRKIVLGEVHTTLKTYHEIRSRELVWFLGALEKRRYRRARNG